MKRFVRIFFILSLAGAAASMLIVGAVLWYALGDLPEIDALKEYHPPQSTVVYDRRGVIIGRLFDERRTVVSLQTLPRYLPLAFVAAEDGDFFEHRGIDYLGLLRAVILEIKFKTVGGRRVGGSTITQQTARAMLLSSTQTYVRKIKEIILAKRIEEALSKEEILSLYLNQIYFGNGAYGVEEAALTYFDKPAKELTLGESAMLASVPKSPNRINPFGDVERMKQRQSYVLDQMIKHNFIDEKSAEKAKNAQLFDASGEKNYANLAPYFLSAVKSELSAELGEEVINKGGLKVYSTLDSAMQKVAQEALEEGLRDFDKHAGFRGPLLRPKVEHNKEIDEKLEQFKKEVLNGEKNKIWNLRTLSSDFKNIKLVGLKNNLIVGARVSKVDEKRALIDLGSLSAELPFHGLSWARPYSDKNRKALPTKASEVLKTGDIILVKLHDVGVLHKKIWLSLEQEPLINGGLVALDVASGGVLAMVGGYDFQMSPFNRVKQSKRQTGSSIKPLLYAAAIDKKIATASSIITDAPKAFYDPVTDDFWRPRNSTNKFLGDITFRKCLRSSINTCSIELLSKLGIDTFVNIAKQVNLTNDQTPWAHNLTLALGSGESYPINVANAMRILPNAGSYSSYSMVERYVLSSGIQKQHEKKAPVPVISAGAAYIITNILQEVIGEQRREKSLNNIKSEIAGKTGTTNDARSVWFFGYTPNVIALVSVSYDDNRSLGHDAWGITAAFPIWAKFMNTSAQPEFKLAFSIPDDIEWHYVEAATGELKEATNLENTLELGLIREAFLAGTAPIPEETEPEYEPSEQENVASIPTNTPTRVRSAPPNKAIFAP